VQKPKNNRSNNRGSTSPARDVSSTPTPAPTQPPPGRRRAATGPRVAKQGRDRSPRGPGVAAERKEEMSFEERRAELAKLKKELEPLERKIKRKEELEREIKEQPVPEVRLGVAGFAPERNVRYITTFKAEGWFTKNRISPDLLAEDSASGYADWWFSNHIVPVKYNGIVEREDIIQNLNDVAGEEGGLWEGDFRDVYPNWTYRYVIFEYIGNVPIRAHVWRAKKPISRRDLRNGWESY